MSNVQRPDGNCIPCSAGTWAENGGSCVASNQNTGTGTTQQQCKPSDLRIAQTQSGSSSDAGTPDAGCKPVTPTAKSCNIYARTLKYMNPYIMRARRD